MNDFIASPLPTPADIQRALADGVTIVTATQRLARQLKRACGSSRDVVATTPRVFSVERWLANTWGAIAESDEQPKRLLSVAEAETLWHQVVSAQIAASPHFSLIQPETASKLGARCRSILKAHRVPLSSDSVRASFEMESDTSCFLSWVDHIDMRLKTEGWLMVEDIADVIAQAGHPKDAELWFLSEEPMTPALRHAFTGRFHQVRWFRSEVLTSPLPTLVFDTREIEIKEAARWGQKQHEENRQAVIILSDYQRDRALLEHHLRSFFGVSDRVFTDLPVNFSRGIELSKVPMFRDAVLLLKLITHGLDRHEISALVRSPFFAWNDRELNDKGQILTALFRTKRGEFDLNSLLWELSRATEDSPLARGLSKARVDRLASLRLEAQDWRVRITQLLQDVGWPNASGLDSLEYQQLDLYDGVFDALEVSPVDTGSYGLSIFLDRLQSVLNKRLFQPQTDQSLLQVMSLGDTLGLSFGAVRVVGSTSESVPEKPAALSFLPWKIVRDFDIQVADEDFSHHITARLLGNLASAAPTVMTYHQVSDGMTNLPSRYCDSAELGLPRPGSPVDRASSADLEWVSDDIGLPLVLPKKQAGGVGLLEAQSVCPMKAHLKYRLGLAALEPASRGLTAGERGGILHQALQFLFNRIRSSDALAALGSSAAHNAAHDAANAAVNDIRDAVRDRVGLPALDLEVARLTRALVDWVTIERQRTVPFEVELTEEPLDWHCEGLTLSLKADRVDRLATGHRVVIDYKSGGSSRVSDWCEIPLKAPQLPCYSQALSDVVTITIAKVGGEDVGFNTLGDSIGVVGTDRKSQKVLMSADVSSLSELSDQWREALTSLVQSFVAGEAVPTPSASACRYCDYAPLCRAHLLESVAQTGSASDE